MNTKLVISCHTDNRFDAHRLRHSCGQEYFGHLDNFVGVYAVMNAYFSGALDYDYIRIELTCAEETDMAGAHKVLDTLNDQDVVVVVDVTGTRTTADITIEKCDSKEMQRFIHESLDGISFELFSGCPDPIDDEDECDVYKGRFQNVFFLGIPCYGGDYNQDMVYCRHKSVAAATQALIQIAANFKPWSETK
jgi:hypothetical protein